MGQSLHVFILQSVIHLFRNNLVNIMNDHFTEGNFKEQIRNGKL